MNGFIQANRELEELCFYTDSNTFRLFFHCLLRANFKRKAWNSIIIKRGQFITSVSKLSDQLDLTARNIRTALDKLEKYGEIKREATNSFTLITVCKYELYAGGEKADRQANDNLTANDRQASDKQVTTTKEGNNDNKDNNKEVKKKENEISETKEDSLKTKKEEKKKNVAPKKRNAFKLEDCKLPEKFKQHPELKAAFWGFAEMRRQLGKPYKTKKGTETKMNTLAKDVDTYGLEIVIGAIKFAEGAEYQGIFVQSYAKNHQKDEQQRKSNSKDKYQGLTLEESTRQALADGYYDNNNSDQNSDWAKQYFADDNTEPEQSF